MTSSTAHTHVTLDPFVRDHPGTRVPQAIALKTGARVLHHPGVPTEMTWENQGD